MPCHRLYAPTRFPKWNKVHGENDIDVLAYPSSQGFTTPNGASPQIEGRLKERLELPASQRPIDISDRPLQPGCCPCQQQTKNQSQPESDQHCRPVGLVIPSLQSAAFNADRRVNRVAGRDVTDADKV